MAASSRWAVTALEVRRGKPHVDQDRPEWVVEVSERRAAIERWRGSAAAGAARRRIDQMKIPPSELAGRHWRRARITATAGAGAWRNGSATSSHSRLVN